MHRYPILLKLKENTVDTKQCIIEQITEEKVRTNLPGVEGSMGLIKLTLFGVGWALSFCLTSLIFSWSDVLLGNISAWAAFKKSINT